MKSVRNVSSNWFGLFTCVVVVALLALVQSANATIIAYDGFSDGGKADGRATNAVSYTTSPVSTNGINYDSLHSQSPISIGFADEDAWNATNGFVAAPAYFQAQSGGLMYTNFAPYTKGQARFFRSSGTIDTLKVATHTATTTDLSDVQWVAMLVYFRNAPSTNTLYQDFFVKLEYGEPGYESSGDGAWTAAKFGVRMSDGKGFYETITGGAMQNAYTASALSAGTHLFLLKFDDRPGTSNNDRYDDVTLWVDPVLTEDPDDLTGGLAAVSIMRSDLDGVMHAFDNLKIAAAVKSGNEIIFDEFVITDDYSDIFTPDNRATFQTVDATYIRSREDFTNTNFNGEGRIIVGSTSGSYGGDIVRGLIEFDLSAIPSSDKITAASLFMTTLNGESGINDVGAPGDLTAFNIYAYGSDIDETTATWNAPDVHTNDIPGGTQGVLLSTASVNVETKGLKITFDDTPAFRDAVEDALDDDGILRLMISSADEMIGTHNFARFSDETVSPTSNRPELLLSHLYVSPQGTVILIH